MYMFSTHAESRLMLPLTQFRSLPPSIRCKEFALPSWMRLLFLASFLLSLNLFSTIPGRTIFRFNPRDAMKGGVLDGRMQKLRLMVGNKRWDYCVYWKMSYDQSCLEWMDCCCVGAQLDQLNGENISHSTTGNDFEVPCRDMEIQHLRTDACERLSRLPLTIALDSGFYGETFFSNQHKWIISSVENHGLRNEGISAATKVLIPVPGGLVELFVSDNVVEDSNVIEFVIAQFIDDWRTDSSSNTRLNAYQSFPSCPPHGCLPFPSIEQETDVTRGIVEETHCYNNPHDHHPQQYSGERLGLSNDISSLNFSEEQFQAFEMPEGNQGRQQQNNLFQGSLDRPPATIISDNEFREMEAIFKQEVCNTDSMIDCSDQNDEDEEEDVDQTAVEKEGRKPSKNLEAERKRRKKLNDKILALRSIVPKITKMNKAATLRDAIDYIKELEKEVKELKDELEEDHFPYKVSEENVNIAAESNQGGSGPSREREETSNGQRIADWRRNKTRAYRETSKACGVTDGGQQQMEVMIQVEVSQVGANELSLKILSEGKAGGFSRLMEALDSLGLDVITVNVITFSGLVLSLLNVEARDENKVVQADPVRDSLLRLMTRNPNCCDE